MILRKSNVAESGAESFADDAPIPHTDLVDTREAVRSGAIAHAIDDEDPDGWNR